MENKEPAGTSILFVDDESVIRKSLTRELSEEHFTVTAVADGNEAISALRKAQYDLVITDLMMAGIDGFGVLKAVKEQAPLTRVIILTGYGNMRFAIDALRLGADDFTIKPCDIEELVFRIRRCLEKRSLLQLLMTQKHQLEKEIEARRVIEEQLRESENRFRLALDASSNGVWDRNLLSGETYFGENVVRTLGYDPEDREEFAFEDLLHPDDRQRVLTLRDDHIRGKTPRYEAEYRLRNKDGGWQWILSRGQVIARDKQGRALRMVGTLTDITSLKDAEAALLRSRTELEQRVRERTAELLEANVALKVVLKKTEEDRMILSDRVNANSTRLVEPLLDRLKACRLTEKQQELVDILQANIKEVTSPFADNFSSKLVRLTPAEIQVANFVKLGKRTKEIAEIMHLSPGTISIHRKNIRKKLDLTNKKNNLQTILSMHS
jgi:PAS domain S-box-containing protein